MSVKALEQQISTELNQATMKGREMLLHEIQAGELLATLKLLHEGEYVASLASMRIEPDEALELIRKHLEARQDQASMDRLL